MKFDSRMVRQKISSDLKKEKEEIKEVLNQEFGWKRNKESLSDSLIIEDDGSQHFKIEWENTKLDTVRPPDPDKKKRKDKSKKKDDQDFIIIWDEEPDTLKYYTD